MAAGCPGRLLRHIFCCGELPTTLDEPDDLSPDVVLQGLGYGVGSSGATGETGWFRSLLPLLPPTSMYRLRWREWRQKPEISPNVTPVTTAISGPCDNGVHAHSPHRLLLDRSPGSPRWPTPACPEGIPGGQAVPSKAAGGVAVAFLHPRMQKAHPIHGQACAF